MLVIGLISLLGDFVYEGGRSVLPDYMRQLGMDAFYVGLALGLAELAGWVARPVGGYVADKTGRYGLIVKVGYAALLVIPLMGVLPVWWIVVMLAFAERVFKGFRVPPRDAMLAKLRGNVGLGTAFGIHELLDQVGAAGGPLLAIIVITLFNNTPYVFLSMAIPYVALLFTLTLLPSHNEPIRRTSDNSPPRQIIIYSGAAALNSAGLLPIPLVLFMVSVVEGTGSWLVPATYTLAMIVDAVAGLILGRAFDKLGAKVIAIAFVLAALPPLMIYSSTTVLFYCALVVGMVIGAQESVLRAAVAQLAGPKGLSSAYAYYGLAIGIGSAVAGAVFGYMLRTKMAIEVMLLYSTFMQAVALVLLSKALKSTKQLSPSD